MDSGTELIGAQPPAVPVRKGAGQGAEEGEGSVGDPFRASPRSELGKGGAGEKRWEEGILGHPFIGLEGERGGQAMEGNGWRWWRRHDGGGSNRFGRGSTGAVVGSDERGCSGRFSCGRRAPGGGACARDAVVAASAVQPGRKTIGRCPRVGERGRGGLTGPAKGRGLVAGGGGGPMAGERGVGQPGWKERRATAGLNPEPGKISKRNSF
jgi:hypothetical protein